MRKPLEAVSIFKERRERVADKLGGGTALIVSAPQEFIRNGSVHFSFRQDSNLYYLTGFEEPESILVLRPGMQPQTVMFVRTKNMERETWDGFRFGPEATEREFKIDKCYPIEEFEKVTTELLKGVEKLYYRQFKNLETDEKVKNILLNLRVSLGRTGHGLLPVFDADEFLGEFRVKKTPIELAHMREAGELSSQAHIETMKYVRPGMSEREIHGFLVYQFMKRGAAREGYGTIVAGGSNATTLHYVFNDQKLNAQDLLLIDAGGEYNYYTADITRTFPVGARFTEEQAQVYEGVLNVQKQIIAMAKPGVKFQDLHTAGAELLTDLILELGFMSGRKEDIIKANLHRKYYPHGIGHFLGMDVHDSGLYVSRKNDLRVLEENMTFTIEPGLYIPANDTSVPERYRGIGVRIEDNVCVTPQGLEIFTKSCPKEISDLTKIVGQG